MDHIEHPRLVTAKARYGHWETDRRPFLDRARQCSALTIPSVMPPEGTTKNSELPTPYQSLGARGARTLASKLLLSLFPSVPFFNYRIDDMARAQLGTSRGKIEELLASRERATVLEMETSAFRPVAYTGLLNLVICGDVCLYVPPDPKARAKLFRMDQYVVRRDHAGNLLEAIIKEEVDFEALPIGVQQVLLQTESWLNKAKDEALEEAPVELYTVIKVDYQSKRIYVHQEAETAIIPNSEGHHTFDNNPYLFLRLVAMPGENYGRSYVEEYLGDLDSLEALSETLVLGSAAAARVVFLVKPGGVTSLEVVAKASTGDVVSGRVEDVQAMQVQKQADLTVAREQAMDIANRLSYAFLLHSAVQRKGERVTAEEIRYMASELDTSLGGVYTLLAVEFQLPIVKLFERRMEKRTGAGPLPSEIAKPVIVAGLEAIGRGTDQQNLRAFIAEVLQTLGPEQALMYLNPLELMKRSAAAYNIDTKDLIPTEEEVQQRQQAAQLQQMIAHLGPQAISAAGGVAQEGAKNVNAQLNQGNKG
ncbi:MAG: portal protein [bacterium]